VELRQYLDILKRRKWFIAQAVVIVGLAAGIVSMLRTPVYEATARVLLRPNDPTEQLNPEDAPRAVSNDPDRYVSAQKDIVESEDVAREAAKSLRGTGAEDVQEKTSVQSGTSDVLEIAAHDVDPVRARDIADAVAKGYIENRRLSAVSGLERAVSDIEGRLRSLQARIGELDTRIGDGAGLPQPGATAVPLGPANPAAPPNQPTDQVTSGLDLGGMPTTQESLKAARYAAAVQYQSLFSRQQDLLVETNLKRGGAELVSLAKVPTSPVSPKPLRDGVLGVVVGLLLGAGISLLREQLDDRVHSSHEVERVTGLATLAQLPYDEESAKKPDQLAVIERPLGPLAEAARSLRTSIQFLGVDEPIKVTVVTSAGPGEGKSLVAATLAAVYAQAGYRTVLVSADLRRPRLSSMFPDSNVEAGLTDVIAQFPGGNESPSGNGLALSGPGGAPAGAGTSTATATVALSTTSVPNLLLMPSGPIPPNPAELLGSRRMAEVLAELVRTADVVVIDTPPLLAVTDAAVLAATADGVVLVTALGETRREAAHRATTILDATGARILGVVVNKASSSDEYDAYHDGSQSPAKGRSERRRAAASSKEKGPGPSSPQVQPEMADQPPPPPPPARVEVAEASPSVDLLSSPADPVVSPVTSLGRRLMAERRPGDLDPGDLDG
jgi:non-specific protein-tyrosine kinase